MAGAGVVMTWPARSAQAPIRVGALTDLSGPLSDTLGTGSVDAVRMAVEDFGFTVLGRKIDVIFADHQNKTDIAASIARRWFDEQDVGLVVDLGNSAAGFAVQDIAREKNRITVTTGAASSELSNRSCSPNSFQWGYDTYQFSKGATGQLLKRDLGTWFFITVDNALGSGIEGDMRRLIAAGGAHVVGSAKYPPNAQDFSAFLLEAQTSSAQVIVLANAVAELQNVLKQGQEFQTFQGRTVVAPALVLVDIHGVGLEATQGTVVSTVFYWDRDAAAREFSSRFRARNGKPPTEAQAMNYSAVTHYLKSVQAAGTAETGPVLNAMRAMKVNDMTASNASIRADGRLMRDIFLAKVKSPAQSRTDWDYLEILSTIPAQDAFRPASESACRLLKA